MKPKQRSGSGVLDPVAFARQILGHKTWSGQEAVLRSVAANRRTAVKACHASSKTFTAAEAALWWATRYRDGKVLITAPGWTQVRSVIWPEVHKSLRLAKYKLPAEANQTELKFSESNFILGLSTNEGVRFQGFHSGHVLIIIDEAVGVEPGIWEAIEGVAAGGQVHLLALGNPTVASGAFYEAFTRNRGSWSCHTLDAFETPNLEGLSVEDLLALPDAELDRNPWPELITRRWVRERYAQWWNGGPENSPLWQSRVRGEFPSQSENSLISLAWLEEARKPTIDSGGEIRVGVDPAGPGSDLTAATAVCGSAIMATRAWSSSDARGDVVGFLRQWGSRLGTVVVDSAGLGYHFGTHLRDLGFRVELTNVGTSPNEPERFVNRKAECYWNLREEFRDGRVSGLVDDDMFGELAGIRYELDSRGHVVMESKAELKRRGVRSPDRAESLMLAIGTIRNSAWEHWRAEIMPAASWRPESVPANNWKADPLDWIGQRSAAPPRRWVKTCIHCNQEISDGQPYTNELGAAFRNGQPAYSHTKCAQLGMTGQCAHCNGTRERAV